MPLIIKLVTIEFSFLLLIISAIITSKTINILGFSSVLYSSIYLLPSSTWFEYSVNSLGSLKWLNPVLSLLLVKNWYLASYGFLNLIMYLFFQFLNPLLLIFYMDDLEYTATLNYVNTVPALFYFYLHNHQN